MKTFSLLTDLYTHQNSCTLIHVSSCWSREGEFVCTIEDTVISFTTTVRNTASLWKGSSNAPATAATATQTKHRHTWQLDLDLSSHPASIFMNYKTFPKTPIWSLPPPIYFTTDRPCVTMSQSLERVCAIQTKHNTYDQKWGSFPSDCWLHKGPETSPFHYMKTLNQVNGHLENLQTLHDFIKASEKGQCRNQDIQTGSRSHVSTCPCNCTSPKPSPCVAALRCTQLDGPQPGCSAPPSPLQEKAALLPTAAESQPWLLIAIQALVGNDCTPEPRENREIIRSTDLALSVPHQRWGGHIIYYSSSV